MKIYFNGCSWTWGAKLSKEKKIHIDGKVFHPDRFSTKVCEYFNAEEVNDSMCGVSNHYIVRTSLKRNPDDYDLAIIQLTVKSRNEYHDGCIWKQLTTRNNPKYYDFYSDEMGWYDEYISHKLLSQHFNKCIFLSIERQTKVKVDLQLRSDKKPRNIYSRFENNSHPNEEGHIQIASDIIKIINEKKIFI